MPTQDYRAPNLSQAVAVDPSSAACTSPLTHSPDHDGLSSSTQSVPPIRRDVDAPVVHEGSVMFVDNNTGHGMAIHQEESLYVTPAASPGSSAPSDTTYVDDTDKMDFVPEDSMPSKANGGVGSLDTPLVTTFPPSPISLPPSSPNPLPEEQTEPLTTTSIKYDIEIDQSHVEPTPLPPAVDDICMDLCSKTAQEQGLHQGTKVDQELDWASTTMAWDFSRRRQEPRYPSSLLQCNSRYEGTQQSDRQVYNVSVRILTVDMTQCTCTGYLTINGLTPEHETLQTYFTGEIIGGPDQRYSFRTGNPEWGASDRTDLIHWARFPAWRPYAAYAKKKLDFAYPPLGEDWSRQDNIFMRWKEHFLVPDHKTKSIAGASFEGFYYICLNQIEGKISGIYFHAKSEKYQQLELNHEGTTGIWHRGITPSVEFR